MSDRVRNHDWASTALGPIDTWPIALRMAVEMILGSQFPKCLVWGPELISLYNDAFVPILGDKRASLGQAFSDIWHEAWDNIGPIAERAFAGEATYIENYPLRINRNGQPEDVYFTFCYSPVRDEHGTVVGMLDTVVEMTDKYLVEQQLRDLAASLEKQVLERTADRNRLWTLSTDIMLVCDMTNTIIAVNPAWQTVLGWSEEEMIGRDALAFVHPQDLERARHATADLSHGIPLTRFDNRQLHRDGSYRWISWAAVPGDGVINAVGRDITAEREQTEALHQAEELLRHSQKMEAVGQLTGGLAHDFNNLLVGITGSLELLEMRIKQGRVNELDRYLNAAQGAAQGAAQRAAALTHRLLAFSRRQTLDPKPTDINRLITGMEELIRRTVGPNIQVEVVGAVGIWTALVDPNQLENSLLNLCINARDAMPHGGRLTIETANKWLDDRAARQRELPAGQYLSLCVTDTGSGMSPDIIKRAFDPFFTTKPTGQGTGLGLSMVYGFARQSGGQVRIYSELGQGTTMCIYLPRHYGEAENDIEVLNSPNVMRGEQDKTVLVIDDEPTVRMLVTEVLSELGYHAVEAGDGAEGLSILQGSEPIDLLISDVGLPGGMNGRQVADAARIIRPALKVLFITGYAENAVVGNGHLEPGMQVLTKPFAMDVLAERIRDLLTD